MLRAKKGLKPNLSCWVSSNTNHARDKSRGLTEVFFACFKLPGTVHLNLYLLLQQHLQCFSSQENDTKIVETTLQFALELDGISKSNLFYSALLCIKKGRKSILSSVLPYQSSQLHWRMHFYQDFPQAVNKHRRKVKSYLAKMSLTLLLTARHKYLRMEKAVKQSV